jgi:hypothetical protein
VLYNRGMAKTGKPENKGENKVVKVTLPTHHYDYLTLLARRSRLGVTEPQVAAHILIRELDAMFDRGYHEKKLPPD